MDIQFYLNGKEISISASPETPLLEVLRSLEVFSVRFGCETGNCGVCSLWLDGVPVLSCSVPIARVAGREVTTVEGVGEKAERLARYLSEEGADQCGYCSPGLIMTILAIERDGLQADPASIAHYLNGNLCRCSGYQSQLRAVQKYFSETEHKEGADV